MKNLNLTSKDCYFRCNDSKSVFYKYSKYSSAAFAKEFRAMKQLESSIGASLYLTYFPRYYEYGITSDGDAFISMDFIKGVSLETLLAQKYDASKKEPRFLFTPDILSHICHQIHEALTLLCQNGILYFDLNPKNILIVNDSFDLRLIDFTYCCQISDSAPYRLIDNRIPKDFPLALTLQHTMMLFFTRLFYSGDAHYNLWFANESSIRFFQTHFGMLFDNVLFSDEDEREFLIQSALEHSYNQNSDYLFYLDKWFSKLKKRLELIM